MYHYHSDSKSLAMMNTIRLKRNIATLVRAMDPGTGLVHIILHRPQYIKNARTNCDLAKKGCENLLTSLEQLTRKTTPRKMP